MKDSGVKPQRFVREIRLPADEVAKYNVGQVLVPKDVFADNAPIDVEGTSKGKGYQGVIKRHHMAGTRATHGTHEYFRHGGSIGCRLTPQRVHKGKRMAGQMGNEKVAVQNLQLFRILADDNVILVRGAVPGAANEYVVVTNAATRTRTSARASARKRSARRTRSRRPRRPPPAASRSPPLRSHSARIASAASLGRHARGAWTTPARWRGAADLTRCAWLLLPSW
jgi:hypothetical protein